MKRISHSCVQLFVTRLTADNCCVAIYEMSPGGRPQSGDPCLQHSLEENGWVFAGEHVVDAGQSDEGVDQ